MRRSRRVALLIAAAAVVPAVGWLVPWARSASADPFVPLTPPDLVAAAIPAGLALWVPLSFLVAHRFFRADDYRRPGGPFCLSSGYDLRATPHRCPECGTVPPKKAPTCRGF